MPENELWSQLLTEKALKAGWHLARNDMRSDFVDDRFFADAVANNLGPYISELSRTLRAGTYRPRPLVPIDVPKSSLAVRPGTLVHLADRIVLFAIVRLIAPKLDELLPKEVVYSYRFKTEGNKSSLFHETDILDLPFLKRRTIQKYIDPFDPWYALWPKFDEKSKTSISDGYDYLAVSDISAYFENINLEILRALLYDEMHGEQRLINLLVECLESWAIQTESGFRPRRGIPQGTAISSFIGNIFLLPIDRCFETLKGKYDIRYYRYMDDVRIFCRDASVAREMVFTLDRAVRKLHLNLQGSKTRILSEELGEISFHVKDARIDYLRAIQEELRLHKGALEHSKRSQTRIKLWDLGRGRKLWESKDKLCGNKRALTGLSLRAYRMWIGILRGIGDADYIASLLREITLNPDYRLTNGMVSALRTFPRHNRIIGKILVFLKSPLNIFKHQSAELIHALRYSSRLGKDVRDYILERMLDPSEHFYVRIQCSILSGRLRLFAKELAKVRQLFLIEDNELVQCALLIPMAQYVGRPNQYFVQRLMHHPNERIRIIGNYISQLQNDAGSATRFINFVFDQKQEMRVCDYLGYVWYLISTDNREILLHLLSETNAPARHHKVMDVRDRFSEIRAITAERLASLAAQAS